MLKLTLNYVLKCNRIFVYKYYFQNGLPLYVCIYNRLINFTQLEYIL